VNEQNCLWHKTAKCRQARELVKQPNIRLTKYALKLSRKDLRVLAGLLTGHADINRHLTLMQVRNDEICPLCQDVEETTLHLLRKCCALINQRFEILGSHYLEYDDLALLHWRPLLRLAKVSEILNIRVAHWANHVRPQRWANNPPGKEERRTTIRNYSDTPVY